MGVISMGNDKYSYFVGPQFETADIVRKHDIVFVSNWGPTK